MKRSINSDRVDVPPDHPLYRIRRIWLTPDEEAGYYGGFSNEGLWPLCHIAHVRPTFRKRDWDCYQLVNARFADAVVREAQQRRPDRARAGLPFRAFAADDSRAPAEGDGHFVLAYSLAQSGGLRHLSVAHRDSGRSARQQHSRASTPNTIATISSIRSTAFSRRASTASSSTSPAEARSPPFIRIRFRSNGRPSR